MNPHERERIEKRVRYMARPAIAEERLALLPDASIRLQLKTSWRDGTLFLLFTPSEFIEKLIALVPTPKFHLTRYYGKTLLSCDSGIPRMKKSRRILWADLLKRTFGIDVLQCSCCKNRISLVGVVRDPQTIQVTLTAMGLSQRPPPVTPAKHLT